MPPVPALADLAARSGRRRRAGLAWRGTAAAGALALGLVAWEAAVGPGPAWRGAGYGVAAAVLALLLIDLIRHWRHAAPDPSRVARRVERAFPQARGAVLEAAAGGAGDLGSARAEAGRRWLERRGPDRLDAAVAEPERAGIRRWRRAAGALALALGLAVLARPAAGRRVAAALRAPGTLFGAGSPWRVEPGDADVGYGGGVRGRARWVGPPAAGAVVLEWRTDGAAWRAESLGPGPAAEWTWRALSTSREYRLRRAGVASRVFAIRVAAPLAIAAAEARTPGGAWTPLAGGSFPAGERLEIRGRASATLRRAEARGEGGAPVRLTARGREFSGTVRLPAGAARLAVVDTAGRETVGEPFVLAAPGRAFVAVLSPAEDPAALAAAGAWLEVRAGASAGLAALRWETGDGRSGALARVAGARDTTVTAVAPLGAGRAPGDTVRYRVVASPAAGAAAATAWRRAVVPDRAALAAGATAERAAARERLDRALEAAGEAGQDAAAGGLGVADSAAEAADRELRAAADSLGRALDRTLADPDLAPGLAEDLQGARRLLDAAAAELRPRAGLPPDPEAAARARAALLEAIRGRLEAVERDLAQTEAADSLESLAGREGALADETRAADPGEVRSGIAERQAAIDRAAREALDRSGSAAADRANEALDAARESVRSGDPSGASAAQSKAAGAMAEAARGTREEVAARAAERAAHAAALDRAAGEVLFLAGRQRALVDEPAGPDERADRLARQEVVTQGLDRSLRTMAEALGGQPAARSMAEALARAVFATRYADRALRDRSLGSTGERTALADAAEALAGLSRALLLPDAGGSSASGGPGGAADAGAAAARLRSMAEAQRALADALGRSEEPAGGNREAAAGQRKLGQGLEEMEDALRRAGVDPATIEALVRSVDDVAARLDRGLAGAREESDLKALARRLDDLGRMVDRTRDERRRSETARPFVPVEPPPLARRVLAPTLDPEAALAPWATTLPTDAVGMARSYLERLAAEGVRSEEEER